jgi:iron(III) transport system permease protein
MTTFQRNLIVFPATKQTALPNKPAGRFGIPRLMLPLLIGVVLLAPVVALMAELLAPNIKLWQSLWAGALPKMIGNTLFLLTGVGVLTLIVGTSLAWLISAYDFFGRAFFERALLLPLAVPAFVMGFIYVALFDISGPVQAALRDVFGPGFRLPPVRSGWGAVIVLSLASYPYVYLMARAAFREQAARLVEAAQSMGYGRAAAFWRVVLPMARPALAGGAVLAMMEAMADFASVRFFSFPTISEAVVRVWEGQMDRASAAEVAALLSFFALGLLLLERMLRGRRKFYQADGKSAAIGRIKLPRAKAAGAFAFCAVILMLSFGIPLGQLVIWTGQYLAEHSGGGWRLVFGQYVGNSFFLAGCAALLVVLLALLLCHDGRLHGGWLRNSLGRLVTLGYSMPGAVVAAGVLVTVAPVDRALNDILPRLGLAAPGILLTGSVLGLLYAYGVRFMAVAHNNIDASMERIKPNFAEAARALGADPWRVMRRIHAPLLAGGLTSGTLLVFVEVIKELPATLFLRPFGMDTLAVWSYMAASESLWQEAALPALSIVALGLLPVLILMRQSNKGR